MVISMLACIVGAIFCWGVYAKTAHQAALIACLIFAAFTAHFLIIYTFTPLTNAFLGKRIHYSLPWFRPKRFEKALYARLGVKRWKSHIPTYNYDEFSLSKHTPEEVIQNMCYAEAVHEVIFAASYLPVLLGLMFSHVLLFLVTSCLYITALDWCGCMNCGRADIPNSQKTAAPELRSGGPFILSLISSPYICPLLTSHQYSVIIHMNI